jgi:hypothetical protein
VSVLEATAFGRNNIRASRRPRIIASEVREPRETDTHLAAASDAPQPTPVCRLASPHRTLDNPHTHLAAARDPREPDAHLAAA